MYLIKKCKPLTLTAFVIILVVLTGQAQNKSQGTSNSSSGRGVIVGKDGQAFRTDANGQCKLLIPDWLFERVKKDPQKYSLKITVIKTPQKYLESKVSDSKVKQGINEKVKQELNDNKLKFSYTIANGIKSSKGDISVSINMSDMSEVSRKSIDLTTFSLSNPNDPNVVINYMLVGEPIPGAEIYVELEPDDEP